jgi:hypothetical protein
LTELFRRKFPTGTSGDTLRSTLLDHGFKPLPTPPADCLPPGQSGPIGRIFIPCPTEDQSKILRYGWAKGICGESITVRWSTDDRHEIARVDASYNMVCP